MRLFPDEYRNLELSRSEKLFTQYANRLDDYGFLILNANPAMLAGEKIHIVITGKGIVFVKFFDGIERSEMLPIFLPAYINGVYKQSCSIIAERLYSNKSLSDGKGLRFPVNYLCVFPNIDKPITMDKSIEGFVENNCLFKEEFSDLKTRFMDIINDSLRVSFAPLSTNRLEISDNNVSSVLQRIAPEYTTIRFGSVVDGHTSNGADSSALVVDANDVAVKAYMLDDEQINIVNKIQKGDQLILACAGSGKSVLLIAKCFKAARMNPDKKFLITCYNRNLQSLYAWYIDRAGLKERNVECITYFQLCKRLLERNGCFVPKDIDTWTQAVASRLGTAIRERYYGIFIDEVQMFEQDWYKLCYNLLENKNSDEHLFVICGDKTQKVKNQQKHGRAPWNAGEGYPNYRGGHKNIRIEKNYRNCVEVNEYINRFVENAKRYIASFSEFAELDPDLFLRGKAERSGNGVRIERLKKQNNVSEAKKVLETIKRIHDVEHIPYDEIAVIMFNRRYRGVIKGWEDKFYNLEDYLTRCLTDENIPFCCMYNGDNGAPAAKYGSSDGVAMISTESVLGLDFRAVILCGLKPLGYHDKTKFIITREQAQVASEDDFVYVNENISHLYVACTRAKELLYIIQPEGEKESIYMKLLKESL
jgi:hypothetical protein